MLYSMMILKTLLAYVLIVSSLAPYTKAYAFGVILNSSPSSYEEPTEDNLKFIVSYKAYIKRLILIQTSVIKKKLVCLGLSDRADFKFDSIENGVLKTELRDFVASYANSDECQTFLNEDLSKMHQAYSDMKVYLALHKSSPVEMNNRVYNAMPPRPVMGGMSQRQSDIRFRRMHCEDPSEFSNLPPRHQQRCEELKGLIEYDLKCEDVQVPLQIDRTSFCLERIISIFNVSPTHVMKKFSIGAFDYLFSEKDLPPVEDLAPLTWREAVKATDIFKNKFIDNESGNQDLLAWASDDVESSGGGTYATKDRAGSYFAASSFQAQGMHLFSEYAEDSAPREYAKILSTFPVLSFYKPSTRASYLNCNDVERNLEEICKQYVQQLGLSVDYNSDLEDLKKGFGEAYLKVLSVNTSLINSINMEMDSSAILNSSLEVKNDVTARDVDGWENLIKMSAALDRFLILNPDHDGSQTFFVEKLNRRENWQLGLSLVGVIGLGVACSFIGSPFLLVGCLVASGIGANLYFYNTSLDSYESSIEMFFSNPTGIGEHDLSLINFDSMKQDTQALVLDTLMVGVGLSAGKITQTSKRIIKDILDSSLTRGL